MWKQIDKIPSKFRVIRLKNVLRTLKKGGITINEYIGNMEDVYDVLIANG